jgi:deoxyribonuclease V
MLHRWDLDRDEMKAKQQELATQVVLEDQYTRIGLIAGVDMAINELSGMARAAVVLLSFPELTPQEQHIFEEPLRMAYVPGLLSFRELPCVLGALARLRQQPDLIMADGQGIAHPRGLGIAAHLGIWTGIPTIGCAKSILVGNHEPVGENVGDWQPLIYQQQTVGAALRTRAHVKPMIISAGHKISLQSSISSVLACGRGYRLPEPTRLADKLSKNNLWQESTAHETPAMESLWQ